ncbi:unnamed protein product, partial [Mesorhabditis spiculigera]
MAHDQTASNLELLLASCEEQIERSETNNNQQSDDLNTSQHSDSSSSSVQFIGVHRPVRNIHPPARYAPYVDIGSALKRARLRQLQDQQQQSAVPPAYPVRLNPVPEPHLNSFFTPGRPLAPYGWCLPSQNLQPQSQPNRSFGSQSVPDHRFAGNQGMGQPQATQSFDRMWNIPQPARSAFDLANRGDGSWGLDHSQPVAQAQQRPATPVSKSLNIAPPVEKTMKTPPRRSGRPSKASKNAKQPPTPHAGYPRCLEDALVCQPSSSATSVIIDGRPALVQFLPPADAPSTSTAPSAPRPRGRPRTKDRTSLASNNKSNKDQNPKRPPPMSTMRTPQLRSGQNPKKPPPMTAMKNPVPAAPVPPPVMPMPAPVPQPPPIQPVVPPPGMTPEIIEAFMALLAQYLAYWRQPGVQAAGHVRPPAANH